MMKEINISNIEKMFYEKLDNGLEVYLLPMNNKKNFHISFNVKYGNSYLDFKINDKEITVPSGVAHFLEHKLFEREDIIHPFKFFSTSGTDVNAATSIYYTTYYCSGNNKFNENLKYLLNWITKIDITDEKVEKEKGIIIQESRMHADNPGRLIFETIKKNTFVKDNFGKKVIGEEKDILSITKEDLINSYNSFYRPDNMFIVIAGNFDYQETINIIKNELKDFKNPDDKITKIEIDEPNKIKKVEEIIKMDVSTPRVCLGYKIDLKLFDIEKYQVLDYIAMILKILFGNTSKFYEEGLKDDLFVDFNYSVDSTYDKVFVNFSAITNKPDELCKAVEKQLKIRKITKEEVARVKKVWLADEIKSLDSLPIMVNYLIYEVVTYGKYIEDKLTYLKNIDLQDLENINKKLDFKNQAIVKILSKNK